MDNLFFYSVNQDEIGSWDLTPGQAHTIKDDLFDGDIYCQAAGSGILITPLENKNIEIKFLSGAIPLKIANAVREWLIEGPICSLNDLWLNFDQGDIVISSDSLNLTPTSITEYLSQYQQNLNYHVDISQRVDDEINESNSIAMEDHVSEMLTPEMEDPIFDEDEIIAKAPLLEGDLSELDDNDINSFRLADEFANIVSQAQKTKKSKFSFLKFKWLEPLTESKFVKLLIRWYLYVKAWAKKNILIVSIVFTIIIMIISIATVLIINNIQNNKLHQAESNYYQQMSDQEQLILKITKTLPIINLNMYREYNKFIINGMILKESDYTPTQSKLNTALVGIPASLNIITLKQLNRNIEDIEGKDNLNCSLTTQYDTLNCIGMVNDKDSIKQEVFSQYKYNAIVPLNITLLNRNDVMNYLNRMFSDEDSFGNLNYYLSGNTLVLNGYISQLKISVLESQLRQIITKMPFLIVKNNLNIIEQIIKLRVRQIIFNNYGNTLIDMDGNEYNVGSKYKDFTIVSIQKNNIMLHNSTNDLLLTTPFATDNFTIANDKNNSNSAANSNSPSRANFVDKVFQSMDNLVVTSTKPLDRKGIINEEINKQVADVNKKKLILDELSKAQKSNTNSSLKHAYDDLITNLGSDIAAEEQEIKMSSRY